MFQRGRFWEQYHLRFLQAAFVTVGKGEGAVFLMKKAVFMGAKNWYYQKLPQYKTFDKITGPDISPITHFWKKIG